MESYIDVWTHEKIIGWVAARKTVSATEEVVVLADGQPVASSVADLERGDLLEVGFGSPHHGFDIDISGRVPVGTMVLKLIVRRNGYPLGVRQLVPDEMLPAELARDLSQERWRGNEPHEHLTWGRMMTGDSFIDALGTPFPANTDSRLMEVGPGYGRLLRTLLERGLPFGSYLGLELSAERVNDLRAGFKFPNVAFERGDVMQLQRWAEFDITMCSSTFEHLYPSCLDGLRNLAAATARGGLVAVDFIDPRRQKPGGGFEENGTYVRFYTEAELDDLHAASGLNITQKRFITLGDGTKGPVERILVLSQPAHD